MSSEIERVPADDSTDINLTEDNFKPDGGGNNSTSVSNAGLETSDDAGQAYQIMFALINNQAIDTDAIETIATATSGTIERVDLTKAICTGSTFWKVHQVLRTDLYMDAWRKNIITYYQKHADSNYNSLSYADLQAWFRDLATAVTIVQDHVFKTGSEQHKIQLLYGRTPQNMASVYQIDSVDSGRGLKYVWVP